MKLNSQFHRLCPVILPYKDRQCYMHEFDLAKPVMPPGYKDYDTIVKTLCWTAGVVKGTAYLTVDEKVVKAGMSQRKPKPHVDGSYSTGSWGGQRQWLHDCNNIRIGFPARMSVIVAASVKGCKAWRGTFDGEPSPDGDLSHIQDQLRSAKHYILQHNMGYLLSPDCIHESMKFKDKTKRTFLRIALPLDFDFFGEKDG